ncbi:hypothetical protein QBC38DRAFT_200709 [Podospora fimiseda]|uniref:Uncharacterized protein n=1 Tax=Podospora fimiseda TaxID=252190 RepID=A0AAN7BXX3_9PEZI|nr:hypothetical protein QBC38DRAFT_200709 [Podospora fimiseda]
MALDQSNRGIGFLRPSSLGVGIGLNKFNVVARGKSSPLEPPTGHSSFLKTILNIQGFNAPGPLESEPENPVVIAEKVVSTVQVESVSAVESEAKSETVTPPVESVVEIVSSTEPEFLSEPTIVTVLKEVPASIPTEEPVVKKETETKEIETQTEELATTPAPTFLTLTPAPPTALSPPVLAVDPTWVDESFDAPVTPEKILALLEKAPGSIVVQKVAPVIISEEVVAPVSVSEEDVPAPISEEAAEEPVPEVAATPVVIPVEKVLAVDPSWTDASLDAPVDAATILGLPLGSIPVVEQAVVPVEEIAAPIEEPVALVEVSEAPATSVEVEELSKEEDVVADEEAPVTIEPVVVDTPAAVILTVDPVFTDDSFNAPVTPETILALPNGITVIAVPVAEEQVAAPVSEPEVIAISEPEATASSEPEVVTISEPEIIAVSEPEVAPVTPVPAIKILAVDSTYTDSALEAPVTPEKLLALPEKVLSAPISVICCIPASPVSDSSSFPRLTSDEAIIQTNFPVINAHRSSVAIALEHIEDITTIETPVTQSSSSSFSPATITATEEECFSSASSVADLDVVFKPAKKVVRAIEPVVWPLILEDDFDAAVSSVLPAGFDLESLMDLDWSWTVPQIKQSERDPKEVAAEKAAVKALVRGNFQGRRLADAADRLEIVVRGE